VCIADLIKLLWSAKAETRPDVTTVIKMIQKVSSIYYENKAEWDALCIDQNAKLVSPSLSTSTDESAAPLSPLLPGKLSAPLLLEASVGSGSSESIVSRCVQKLIGRACAN